MELRLVFIYSKKRSKMIYSSSLCAILITDPTSASGKAGETSLKREMNSPSHQQRRRRRRALLPNPICHCDTSTEESSPFLFASECVRKRETSPTLSSHHLCVCVLCCDWCNTIAFPSPTLYGHNRTPIHPPTHMRRVEWEEAEMRVSSCLLHLSVPLLFFSFLLLLLHLYVSSCWQRNK